MKSIRAQAECIGTNWPGDVLEGLLAKISAAAKDPVRRKRLSRPAPKEQHKAVEAPHLRIIDDATWKAAQAVKAQPRHSATPETVQKGRSPKRVFSGLIKCGCCGGGMSSNGTDRKGVRVQCSAYKESGSCTNGRRVYLDDIEALAIKGLRQHLAHPDLIAAFVDTYNEERKRLQKEGNADRTRIERRLGDIEREIKRIVDLIVKDTATDALVPKMNELEAERKARTAKLEEAKEGDNVIALHPKAIDRYKRAVRELADEFKRGTPTDDRSVRIDIKGRLAALCYNPAVFPNMAMSGGSLVAGERYPDSFPLRSWCLS